jgi:hypothetical protein
LTDPVHRQASRAWIAGLRRGDLRWVVGTIFVPVLVAVIPIVLTHHGQTAQASIAASPPTVDVMREGDFLKIEGVDPGDTPAPELRSIGAVLQSNVTFTGYNGQRLEVFCFVTDRSSLKTVTDGQPHTIVATGRPQTTEPCWVHLPSTRASRSYRADIYIDDLRHNQLQAKETSFSAP